MPFWTMPKSIQNQKERLVFVSIVLVFNKCHLAVSNPGREISQEDLKNIFRRFYRLDKSRNRDGSFGLGLSIAENIVNQHKGKIWAESKDGINTFFVEFNKRC